MKFGNDMRQLNKFSPGVFADWMQTIRVPCFRPPCRENRSRIRLFFVAASTFGRRFYLTE